MSRQNAPSDRSRYLSADSNVHALPLSGRSSRHVSSSTEIEYDRPFERPLSPLGYGDGKSVTPSEVSSRLSEATAARRNTGRRRERKRRETIPPWKKLLWVRQPYPDNYTDASTFLDHLQRNQNFQPYHFWRLVADSTVIVQQVCSVTIFVCCFIGIFQERVSPVTIVGCGSAGTVLGWIAWDLWVSREEASFAAKRRAAEEAAASTASASIESEDGLLSAADSTSTTTSDVHSPLDEFTAGFDEFHPPPQVYEDPLSSLSPRNQQRLATMKSAALIYCAVLGMSPILKSLTKSTTSDSIWAMSFWLMGINLFFFDYGGGVGAKFPASLSTNAALMASTVLASRLTSTTHVFLLTLFSIQVFGLFPVFRRHLLHVSRTLHHILTFMLVLGAGGGVAVTVGGGSWTYAVIGCLLGLLTAAVSMGGASWWLIGLQKWKDEIVGPWDAARPRLRRRWG